MWHMVLVLCLLFKGVLLLQAFGVGYIDSTIWWMKWMFNDISVLYYKWLRMEHVCYNPGHSSGLSVPFRVNHSFWPLFIVRWWNYCNSSRFANFSVWCSNYEMSNSNYGKYDDNTLLKALHIYRYMVIYSIKCKTHICGSRARAFHTPTLAAHSEDSH